MYIYNEIVAIPPGDTIKDELEFLNMKQKDFSLRMDMAEKTISQLISGEAPLSYDTAFKLEDVLGIPAYFWNNLEIKYRENLARIEMEKEIEKEWDIVEKIPYKEIIKREWIKIKDKKNKNEIIKSLKKYFSVSSLNLLEKIESKTFDYYNNLEASVNFRKNNKEISKHAMITWMRKGELEAINIDTEKFSKKGLKDSISKMKKLSIKNSKENIDKLKELCRKNGIALVVIPHLPKIYVDGVSMWLNKDKALIILSNRRKGVDSFWFNFFHEIAHILKHKKKGIFINAKETIIDEIEEEANRYSRNILIPLKEYKKIKDTPLNERKILSIAKQLNVHPAIIVGRLQFDKEIGYYEFNDLKEDIEF